MKNNIIQTSKFFLVLLITLFGTECSGVEKNKISQQKSFNTNTTKDLEFTNYEPKTRLQVLKEFDPTIIKGLAKIASPDNYGALSKNKSGYFHVRFQMSISQLADYAVASEDVDALDIAIKSIEYSFQYQQGDGNFRLAIPNNLKDQKPNPADIASGVSFFLSSVGLGLVDFQQSEWYNSSANSNYKSRIELLRPKLNQSASWLLSQKSVLKLGDKNAPNRLLFDALAFYSLGSWLGRNDLKFAAKEFAFLAIALLTKDGYFLEGGGWDSSYQGVANNVGMNLFSILSEDVSWKQNLWKSLARSTAWQRSRILPSGEISTKGNTRVYSGGESFMGETKAMDWKQTMNSFYLIGYYSKEPIYINLANLVLEYYK
ncbi:hypothetical protein [Leptospira sp. GIMC2001]|uniref:hypothetical protein n=1 Tax=Leptospira sp. GIMC2001 TaxID=1513297 RepID=UPI0023493062|nr:hypothetical protein [Leptospira sp. GIMC2001]WCL50126.1 hypothetical protein O4O04_04730 [Leptospira sp. GIMC2001]